MNTATLSLLEIAWPSRHKTAGTKFESKSNWSFARVEFERAEATRPETSPAESLGWLDLLPCWAGHFPTGWPGMTGRPSPVEFPQTTLAKTSTE